MCAQGAQGSSCGQSLRQCRMVVQAGEAEGGRCTTRPEKRGRVVKRVSDLCAAGNEADFGLYSGR